MLLMNTWDALEVIVAMAVERVNQPVEPDQPCGAGSMSRGSYWETWIVVTLPSALDVRNSVMLEASSSPPRAAVKVADAPLEVGTTNFGRSRTTYGIAPPKPCRAAPSRWRLRRPARRWAR